MRRALLIGSFVIGAALGAVLLGRSRRRLLAIGTQATGAGEGIFAAWFDDQTGGLAPIGWIAEIERPTWLTADPRRRRLFAVSEVGNAGDREGAVLSFAVDRKSGKLLPISRTSSGGGGATHLALDRQGETLFVANFGGGQVGVIPVAGEGALESVSSLQAQSGSGPHRRQPGPRPHGVTLDPSGEYLLAPDMGADRVFVYRYDAEAKSLEPADPSFVQLPAGSGPRLLLFGRDGRFAYLLTELSAELFVYGWEDGRLSEAGRVALDPPGAEPTSAAAILLSLDGRFLYASNRRTGAIHVSAVDGESGLLAEIQQLPAGGDKPWCFELAPGGKWLLSANQGSDQVQVFSRDRESGRLTAVGEGLKVPSPTGLAFLS